MLIGWPIGCQPNYGNLAHSLSACEVYLSYGKCALILNLGNPNRLGMGKKRATHMFSSAQYLPSLAVSPTVVIVDRNVTICSS